MHDEAADFERDVADRDRRASGRRPRVAAHHQADEFGAVDFARRRRGDGLAVAQHGDAVGDGGDLLEAVRDVDDAHAFGRAAAAMTRKRRSTSRSVSDAVGSSMMSDPARSAPDRLGDLDDLLLGHAERVDQALGIDRGADARRAARAARRCARFPIDRRQAAAGLERERDVLGDGEVREKRGLLVDGGDAEGARDVREL